MERLVLAVGDSDFGSLFVLWCGQEKVFSWHYLNEVKTRTEQAFIFAALWMSLPLCFLLFASEYCV